MARMHRIFAAALLFVWAAVLTLAFALAAEAQSANCADHDVVMERLADGYGESRVAIALGAGNTLVETWANLTSGTWTITVTQAGGPTCLVASGQSFELVEPPPDDPA